MGDISGGKVASVIALIGSLLTLVLGVIYLVLRIEHIALYFERCDEFFEEDCNRRWRSVFTFRPEYFFDIWTPFLLGLLGVLLHVKGVKVRFIRNYVQYAVLMLVTALFGNFGYCGQFGVIVGAYNCFATLCCVIARATGDKEINYLLSKDGVGGDY